MVKTVDALLSAYDPKTGHQESVSLGTESNDGETYIDSDWVSFGKTGLFKGKPFPLSGNEIEFDYDEYERTQGYTRNVKQEAFKLSFTTDNEQDDAYLFRPSDACYKESFDPTKCEFKLTKKGENEPSAKLQGIEKRGKYLYTIDGKAKDDFYLDDDTELFPQDYDSLTLMYVKDSLYTPISEDHVGNDITLIASGNNVENKETNVKLDRFIYDCKKSGSMTECETTLYVVKPGTPIKRGSSRRRRGSNHVNRKRRGSTRR